MLINETTSNGVRQVVITLEPDGRVNLSVSPTVPPELAMAMLEVVRSLMAQQILKAHVSPIVAVGGVVPRND